MSKNVRTYVGSKTKSNIFEIFKKFEKKIEFIIPPPKYQYTYFKKFLLFFNISDSALEVFNTRRKMGGEEYCLNYRKKLEQEVDEAFENFKGQNENKNIFKAANTPITLIAIAMICYVFSQIFGLFGGIMYPFANVLNLILMITFIMLGIWSYCKYTGNFSEIGASIDQVTIVVYDSALQPAFAKMAEEGTNFAARQAANRLNSTSSNPPMSVKKKQ